METSTTLTEQPLNQSSMVPVAATSQSKIITNLGEQLSTTSIESTERTSQYSGSDDEERKNNKASGSALPTFTNEVVVIRPEYFYENTDCQQDNKFMKNSNMQRESTNLQVSL